MASRMSTGRHHKEGYGTFLSIMLMCLIILVSEVALSSCSKLHKRASGDDVSSTTESSNGTTILTNTTSKADSPSKGNTGAVIAAAVIAVIVCIAVVVGVYIFKRRRQSLMMDKEKKMQIQMSSARNAGVYQDLTVSVPAEDKPPASPEHERLKSAEDA